MKIIQSTNLKRDVATKCVPKNIRHSNTSQVVSMYLYSKAKLRYENTFIDVIIWMTF